LTTSKVKLPKQIIDWLPIALVGGILGAIGWFGTQIIHAAADPFLKNIAPAIPQALLLSLCCFLLLIILLLVIWVIYLHRTGRESQEAKDKAFDDRFAEFLLKLGVWKHKTKPGYFCPNCKARHCESPMRERPDGWKCLILECGYFVSNPDYKPPLPQPQSPTLKRRF